MNTNLNIVPLDLCQKLKSFNFSYYCDYFYDKEGNLNHSPEYKDWNLDEDKISAPYAFIVCQWLRNEHYIDLFACRLSNITNPMLGYTYAIFHEGALDPITSNYPEESYELALLKGIDFFCKNVNVINKDKEEKSEEYYG